MNEGGLRRSKKRREEERKEGRMGGEAGGRRDDSLAKPSPRRRRTLNKTFNTLGGKHGRGGVRDTMMSGNKTFVGFLTGTFIIRAVIHRRQCEAAQETGS